VLELPPDVVITYFEGDLRVRISPEVIVTSTVVVPTVIEVAVEPDKTVRVSPELTPER